MKKTKKIILGLIIVIAVLIVLHLSMNYLIPSIKNMHQGVMQY